MFTGEKISITAALIRNMLDSGMIDFFTKLNITDLEWQEIYGERTDRREHFIQEVSPFCGCSSRAVLDPKNERWTITSLRNITTCAHLIIKDSMTN